MAVKPASKKKKNYMDRNISVRGPYKFFRNSMILNSYLTSIKHAFRKLPLYSMQTHISSAFIKKKNKYYFYTCFSLVLLIDIFAFELLILMVFKG